MNYQLHYDRLITKARGRKRFPNSHYHHIIPKWQGGSDKAPNRVWLSYREHYVAHLLLAKWQGLKKNWSPVKLMLEVEGRRTSRMYEVAAANHALSVSGNNNPMKRPEVAARSAKGHKEYIKNNPGRLVGENNGMFGRKHSEYTKELIRQTRIGKRPSEETLIKLRNRPHNRWTEEQRRKQQEARKLQVGIKGPSYGTKRMTSPDGTHRRIKLESVQEMVSKGWKEKWL